MKPKRLKISCSSCCHDIVFEYDTRKFKSLSIQIFNLGQKKCAADVLLLEPEIQKVIKWIGELK